MDTARARLRESLKRHDVHGRFQIYHPVTLGGQPIYVHSKLMIIDDNYVRVGSSNINNRSMRFDKECDVAFDAQGSADLQGRISALCSDLLAEHLGVTPETITRQCQEFGSLIAAIEQLRGESPKGQRKTLVPYETPNMTEIGNWLADNEILDPEGPEEQFEPIEKRGLFRALLRRPTGGPVNACSKQDRDSSGSRPFKLRAVDSDLCLPRRFKKIFLQLCPDLH